MPYPLFVSPSPPSPPPPIVLVCGMEARVSRVTYSPEVSTGSSKSMGAMASLPLERIFACGASGRLFFPWEAKLSEEAPPAYTESLSQFYCSVCPNDVLLRIDKTNVGTCGVCGWSAAQAGIEAYYDLFERDTNPWVNVDKSIKEITRRLDRGDDLDRRSAATDDDLRGRPNNDNNHSTNDEYVPREAMPKGMVVLDGLMKREEIPPRRKLARKTLHVTSPFSHEKIPDAVWDNPRKHSNAARFLPEVVNVVVKHDCGRYCEDVDVDEGCVFLKFRNPNATAITVTIAGVDLILPPKSTDHWSYMLPFNHEIEKSEPTACPKVMEVDVSVQFHEEEEEIITIRKDCVTKHKWAYKMFIWHDYRRFEQKIFGMDKTVL